MSDASNDDAPRRIDYDTTSKCQLYKLALHYSELVDVILNSNNALNGTIMVQHPDLVDRLRPVLDEWARFILHATGQSDAEVGRILDRRTAAERRKMN